MKTYICLSSLFISLLALCLFFSVCSGAQNEQLALHEKVLKSSYYKVGAVSGMSAFAGSVVAQALLLYIMQSRQIEGH